MILLPFLTIGSLPHKTVGEAIEFTQRWTPEYPSCPQLPQLSIKELMTNQFFGMDWEERIHGPEQIEKLPVKELLHQTGVYSEFVQQVRTWNFPLARLLKVQIMGPFTAFKLLMQKKQGRDTERPIEWMDQLCAHTHRMVRQMIDDLRPVGIPIVVQLDEPMLALATQEQLRVINELVQSIRALGALVMIHCCGKMDHQIVDLVEADYYSWDIHAPWRPEKLIPSLLSRTDNGACIVLGMVPIKEMTDELIGELVKKRRRIMELFTQHDPDVVQQVFVSPSCGLAFSTPKEAGKIMEVCMLMAGLAG